MVGRDKKHCSPPRFRGQAQIQEGVSPGQPRAAARQSAIHLPHSCNMDTSGHQEWNHALIVLVPLPGRLF